MTRGASKNDATYLRARHYDPATAQFLSRDPAVATTLSPYAYVGDNPLNASDPLGLWGLPDLNPVDWAKAGAGAVSNAASWTWEHVGKPIVDIGAEVPYGAYYVTYNIAHGLNHLGCDNSWAIQGVTCGLTHVLSAPLVPVQYAGLGGDWLIDALKGDNTCDEGQQIHLDPLHSYVPSWVPDPEVYGPGIHPNGHWDIEW